MHEWFASAAFGLEGIVKREAISAGLLDVQVDFNRVFFSGDELAGLRANLWLRTSERVYRFVGRYGAVSFDELFDGARQLPWEDFIGVDDAFPVVGHCARSQLMSPSDCQSILKKAIVERLHSKHGNQDLTERGARVRVVFSVHNNEVVLGLDASGDALHRRGYRALAGEAPLKETVAAALLMLSPWEADKPLVDPMCGGGTFVLEAALIALGVAPGLNRKFDCEGWGFVSDATVSLAREEVLDAAPTASRLRAVADLDLRGYDIDPKAVDIAREHARTAGLRSVVRFEQADANTLSLPGCPPDARGTLIANPPYGERLGDRKAAEQALAALGDLQRRSPGWALCALSASPAADRFVGRRANKLHHLYNGSLECGFFTFFPQRQRGAGAEKNDPPKN